MACLIIRQYEDTSRSWSNNNKHYTRCSITSSVQHHFPALCITVLPVVKI